MIKYVFSEHSLLTDIGYREVCFESKTMFDFRNTRRTCLFYRASLDGRLHRIVCLYLEKNVELYFIPNITSYVYHVLVLPWVYKHCHPRDFIDTSK